MNRRHQSGFTLIEIAIVLVIIGLLLGGILKGQELITSARVRNMADQGNGVQAAYYGFVDRFRNLPGDWPLIQAQQAIPTLTAGSVNGNGNGRIDSIDWNEPSLVWEHLQRAGFIGGFYQATGQAPNFDTDAPRNAFNGWIVLSHSADYQSQGQQLPTIRLNLNLGRNVPVSVIRELDVKVDDGRPLTGAFRAAPITTTLAGVPVSQANCMDMANNAWSIAADSQDCAGVLLY
jgi:prepilin-type N-terminal cleavage/methylation domain-containing protein